MQTRSRPRQNILGGCVLTLQGRGWGGEPVRVLAHRGERAGGQLILSIVRELYATGMLEARGTNFLRDFMKPVKRVSPSCPLEVPACL